VVQRNYAMKRFTTQPRTTTAMVAMWMFTAKMCRNFGSC